MILITGITGLVGSHLAIKLLDDGQTIRAIYRNRESIEKTKQVFEYYKKSNLFDKINWLEADILDIPSLEKAFENIELVYHCAALISFDPKEEENLRKTNIEGTANMVNFCLAKNIKKLCFVSSISALGDPINKEIITEETDWNPEKQHSDYAISKHGAEMEVWRAQQEGLPIIIINPGVILAPFFWQTGSGEIVAKVKNGLKFYTNGSTGFVTVNDVVTIMIRLMQSKNEGENYILIAENCSYKSVIFNIAKALNVKKPSYKATKLMTSVACKFDWISSNIFFQKRKLSKLMAKSLHSKDKYSNEKIVSTLDYKFENIEDFINAQALSKF
jgi:dihydroflavonol-4-reductase